MSRSLPFILKMFGQTEMNCTQEQNLIVSNREMGAIDT